MPPAARGYFFFLTAAYTLSGPGIHQNRNAREHFFIIGETVDNTDNLGVVL